MTTIAAHRAANGLVYYLQRIAGRDGYEIRHSPGKRPVRVRVVESKAEWREFVAGLTS
jgi:hypothetical protein